MTTTSAPSNPRLMRVRDRPMMRTSMFSLKVASCELRVASGCIHSKHATHNSQLFLLDDMRCEPPNAPIGGQHSQRHVVVKDGERLDDLFVERQTARHADEIRLREEAVVEAHAAADA